MTLSGIVYEVSLTIQSKWWQGGTGQIRIKNVSEATLHNWSFKINTVNYHISDLYQFTCLYDGATTATIGAKSWNLDLNPGVTMTSGFTFSCPVQSISNFVTQTASTNVVIVSPTPT